MNARAEVERGELEASLVHAAQELAVPLSAGQRQRLLDYIDLLAQWNRTYNLTSIRDRAGMLSHHVVDCLAAVPALRRQMQGRSTVSVLDAGSGAGLPGLVIGVMEPGWSVTCVDSVGKKAAFIRHAAGALGLPGVEALHGRVEALAAGYDVVASRAFASLDDFTRRTRAALGGQGMWMAMKGHVPDREIADLADDIEVFHVEQLIVPGLAAERSLVWMRAT